MTPEQRASPENGVWLCQNCAKLIDSDKTKYTREVLLDWKETAEHLAASEIHGIAELGRVQTTEQSISFRADDWNMWRNRGNLPGDSLVFIDGWARGDVRYSVRLRLRNNLAHEEVLHRLRMEFVGDEMVLSDESAFDGNDVVLPTGKWVTLDLGHGLHDYSVFERSSTVWFRAESVGHGDVLRWQVATIDHESVKHGLSETISTQKRQATSVRPEQSDISEILRFVDGLSSDELYRIVVALLENNQTINAGRNDSVAASLAYKGLLEKIPFESTHKMAEVPYVFPTPVWLALLDQRESLLQRAIAANSSRQDRLDRLDRLKVR